MCHGPPALLSSPSWVAFLDLRKSGLFLVELVRAVCDSRGLQTFRCAHAVDNWLGRMMPVTTTPISNDVLTASWEFFKAIRSPLHIARLEKRVERSIRR
eukprot:m.48019 g.48019  ORF g.48019 m.48019 type:complete len:99 (+) comp8892_c0_seq1:2116-2412(+)